LTVDAAAGRLPDPVVLVDVDARIGAYPDKHPDPAEPSQCVAFGTSGHRGTSTARTFNEDNVSAVAQAICRHRERYGAAVQVGSRPAAGYAPEPPQSPAMNGM
jgi:hypothetical protein